MGMEGRCSRSIDASLYRAIQILPVLYSESMLPSPEMDGVPPLAGRSMRPSGDTPGLSAVDIVRYPFRPTSVRCRGSLIWQSVAYLAGWLTGSWP